MLILHTFDNEYSDGTLYRQFVQRTNDVMASETIAGHDTIASFVDGLAVQAGCDFDQTHEPEDGAPPPRKWKTELQALKDIGDIPGCLKLLEECYKTDEDITDMTRTDYGEWTHDALVLVPPTLREQSVNVWDEDRTFPKRDWKYEVANDDTHQGYWEWVENKRDEIDYEAQGAPILTPAVFSFDDGPSVVGYTTGRRWNGWGCPIIDAITFGHWAMRMEALGDFVFRVKNGRAVFDPENRSELEPDDRIQDAEPRWYEINGQLRLCYDFAGLGLTWNQADIDSEDWGRVAELAQATAPPWLEERVRMAFGKMVLREEDEPI